MTLHEVRFFPPSKVYVSIANARCVDEHDIIDWHIGEHADIIQATVSTDSAETVAFCVSYVFGYNILIWGHHFRANVIFILLFFVILQPLRLKGNI